MTATWSQNYFLFGQGLTISAMIAAAPIFTLLLLLGVLRKPAWMAGVTGLAVTFIVAIAGYGMPVGMSFNAATYGIAFGLFPISWIVFWAIVLYLITLETAKFEIIKDSIGSLTGDPRLQALLIAFAFGAFIEGAAGFGTPVAVAAAMLTGLGFTPFYAAAVCLLANTAPVAFGSIGIPVVTLAGITGLPLERVSAAVGCLCAPVSLIIPAYLTNAMGGGRALKAVWPAALVAGVSFAGVQFIVSNFIGAQLTDILSSLSAIVALVALLHFWKPAKQSQAFAAASAGVRSVTVPAALLLRMSSMSSGSTPPFVLSTSDSLKARSGLVAIKAPAVFRADFSTNFSLKWLEKDMGLMLESTRVLEGLAGCEVIVPAHAA